MQLTRAPARLDVASERIGEIPATVHRPSGGTPAPVVVVAHGFAGSQQLMQPFAVTLARAGYVAVTFDFPGHGRNVTPLPGGLTDHSARGEALRQSLDDVVRAMRTRPYADGRVALLGHSMASDVVVRYARDRPDVAATVAVSLFTREESPDRPRNLLIVDGAWEALLLKDEARRIVGAAAGGTAEEGVTYGRFEDGTARRFAFADGVEHIGVLYSAESLREAVAWLDGAFGRERAERPFLDARGPWLGLLYLGIVMLAWPLSRGLPVVARPPAGAALPRPALLAVAIVPALATPLLLRGLPRDILPILLGDYLAAHFGLYGLLTAAGLVIARMRSAGAEPAARVSWPALALAAGLAALYATFAIALPTDRFAASFVPTGPRLALAGAILVGTLPYFLADEWLARGARAGRWAYPATKALFLASLAAAIALDLPRLFFLGIIVPAILAFFVVYGLFSRWCYRRTGHPAVAAIANAVAFSWAIAVTFPLVG